MKPGRFLFLLAAITVLSVLLARRAKEDAPTTDAKSALAVTKAKGKRSARTNGLPVTPAIDPATPDAGADGNRMQVLVVTEKGEVIEGATVAVAFQNADGRPVLTNLNRSFRTGSQGISDLLWPAQSSERLVVRVDKDQFETRRRIWNLSAGEIVPSSYIFRLRTALEIGGFVVDPEGSPVPGAEVHLRGDWKENEPVNVMGGDAVFTNKLCIADSDGHWSVRSLPPGFFMGMRITGFHSNFVMVTIAMEGLPQAEQELRQGIFRLQLRRGPGVRGRVIDAQQQPIAGAEVWAGWKNGPGFQETKTDTEGRFVFRNILQGQLSSVDLSVAAAGYGPAARYVGLNPSSDEEIVFQLTRLTTLRGVVQDGAGQAVDGVRVELDRLPGDSRYGRIKFSTTTDADGRFTWDAAPDTAMVFKFIKAGYERKEGLRLSPGDNVVILRKIRRLLGQVLDADTGKPVTRFTVRVGLDFPSNVALAIEGFSNEEGKFSLELEDDRMVGLMVSAVGFDDASRRLPSAEGDVVNVTVALKPRSKLTATVVTPEGRPVSNAEILVGDHGFLKQGHLKLFQCLTDDRGQFTIESASDTAMVLAANGTCFASVPVTAVRASGIVVMQPNGRVEGVLLRGGEPVAGQSVAVRSATPGLTFVDDVTFVAATDSGGRFRFENVPAGNVNLVRLIKGLAGSMMNSHLMAVVVTPEQTTDVVLGGKGASILGTVKVGSSAVGTDYSMIAELRTVPPSIPPNLSPEALQALVGSSEYRQQMANGQSYAAAIGKDGAIVLDSVAPGRYQLWVTAAQSENGPNPIGWYYANIPVTISEGVDHNTPISIGEVVLKPAK